jgi:hypothetical protein
MTDQWILDRHKDKVGHRPTSDNMCYNLEDWVCRFLD